MLLTELMVLFLRRGCDQHGLPIKFLIHICSTQITKLQILSLIKCWEEANSLQKTHKAVSCSIFSEGDYLKCVRVCVVVPGRVADLETSSSSPSVLFVLSTAAHSRNHLPNTKIQNWSHKCNDTESKYNKQPEVKAVM